MENHRLFANYSHRLKLLMFSMLLLIEIKDSVFDLRDIYIRIELAVTQKHKALTVCRER